MVHEVETVAALLAVIGVVGVISQRLPRMRFRFCL